MGKNLTLEQVVEGLERASEGIPQKAFQSLEEIANDVVRDMKSGLQMQGAVRTGNLLNSIRQETTSTPQYQESLIYADAESEPVTATFKDGSSKTWGPTKYAEFVEYGTGEYNEKGDGRKGEWLYPLSDGTWRRTSGMMPSPFIRPAIVANEHKLGDMIQELDISKYMRG